MMFEFVGWMAIEVSRPELARPNPVMGRGPMGVHVRDGSSDGTEISVASRWAMSCGQRARISATAAALAPGGIVPSGPTRISTKYRAAPAGSSPRNGGFCAIAALAMSIAATTEETTRILL